MKRARFNSVWLGILVLSGMFLMGQQTWPPPECVDDDGDGYGNPASAGCLHSGWDCDDDDADRNPGAAEGPFGHETCSDGFDNDCNDLSDILEPKCDEDDLNMTAADFECLTNWPVGDVYRVKNFRGYQAEAIAVAQDPDGGDPFPPGTVVQLLTTEAMVKRAPGWNPATDDWEFFRLTVNAGGTQIVQRGGAEVTAAIGGTCLGCHSKADPEWDLVCRKTHGCDPLPITVPDEVLIGLQDDDPRCP